MAEHVPTTSRTSPLLTAGRRRAAPPAISHPDYQLLRTVGRVAAVESTTQLYLDAEDAGHPPSTAKVRLNENLRLQLIAASFLRPLTAEGLKVKRAVALAYADHGPEGEQLFRSVQVNLNDWMVPTGEGVQGSDTLCTDGWRIAA